MALFEMKYEVGIALMSTIDSLILYPDDPSKILVGATFYISFETHKLYFIVSREDGSLLSNAK